jgi:hypothetical protein
MVKFVSYRDLRNTPSSVWEALDRSEAVAIVSNGEPRALMLSIEGGDIEGAMHLVRRLRAHMALSRLRAESARSGTDRLTDADVEAEIAAARAERRERASSSKSSRRKTAPGKRAGKKRTRK